MGGREPFGWLVGNEGALIEIPEQQAAIRRMVEMWAAGTLYRTIAAAITEVGFPLSHEGHEGAKKIILAATERQTSHGNALSFSQNLAVRGCILE